MKFILANQEIKKLLNLEVQARDFVMRDFIG